LPVDPRLLGRLVVVSPHLDDAVLSLGATLAHAVESGATVEVLTVFACALGSSAPTDDWDRKSGFTTEGQAAQQRRSGSMLSVTTAYWPPSIGATITGANLDQSKFSAI